MQEQTTSSNDSQQPSASEVKHQYYEAGREILSKPNLLCDLVESLEAYPVLIYCNTPSDTDFVEVMLRKRGIASQKLIGNVPQDKIDSTLDLVAKGQLTAIVLTDIAARLLDITPFKAAINYSSPQDADTYLERSGQGRNNSLEKVITLITPLELASFHFVKKALAIEPEVGPQPSPEKIAKARLQNLKNQALKDEAAQSEANKAMAAAILADSDKDSIVAFLVNNTISVIPALRSANQSRAEEQEEEDFEERPDRWNKRGGGRSGGRQDRGGDNYRGRSDKYSSAEDDYSEEAANQREGNRGGERGERRQKTPRAERKPVKKDARIYLNSGSEEGFSKDNVVALLEKHGLSADSLKHLSIRKNYSFFDIEDEKSTEIIDSLKAEAAGKTAVKAITINAVMPEVPEAESAETQEGIEPGELSADDDFADDANDNIGNR